MPRLILECFACWSMTMLAHTPEGAHFPSSAVIAEMMGGAKAQTEPPIGSWAENGWRGSVKDVVQEMFIKCTQGLPRHEFVFVDDES